MNCAKRESSKVLTKCATTGKPQDYIDYLTEHCGRAGL